MIVSNSGTLAAVVRQGDYLVFKSEKWGVAVEYSPDAEPGAPVVGGFAAQNGRATYFSAEETSKLLQNHPLTVEDELVLALEIGSKRQRPKSTVDVIMGAIRIYADSGYETTAQAPVWDGRLTRFHKEVVGPLTGLTYTRFLAKTYKRIPAMLPGVEMFSLNCQHWIRVDWPRVESRGN
jgi:hypothetical protein